MRHRRDTPALLGVSMCKGSFQIAQSAVCSAACKWKSRGVLLQHCEGDESMAHKAWTESALGGAAGSADRCARVELAACAAECLRVSLHN